jgi:hypothetical protein
MNPSLTEVFERLSKRAGVLSVTFCTNAGLVVHTTLLDAALAARLGEQFARLVAQSDAIETSKSDPVQVLTVRSAKVEWIVSLADALGEASQHKNEFFFVVARDPAAK